MRTLTVGVEHLALASPRTASLFVGERTEDGIVDQHRRSALLTAVWAVDTPPHTLPGDD